MAKRSAKSADTGPGAGPVAAPAAPAASPEKPGNYLVLARKYRPASFSTLIG